MPSGQPRAPLRRRGGRREGREARRLPGHARRDRLPHPDGERPGRPGLGRGRHRGGGRHAGRAVPHAHPPGRRGGAQGRAARRSDAHRPRPRGNRAPEKQEFGRRLRGVFRGRVLEALGPGPGHARKHVPRVRRDGRLLARRQGHRPLSQRHWQGPGSHKDGRGVLQAARAPLHSRVGGPALL